MRTHMMRYSNFQTCVLTTQSGMWLRVKNVGRQICLVFFYDFSFIYCFRSALQYYTEDQ